jgi:hypothetical protein
VHWGTQELYTSYQRGLKLKPFPRKDIHLIAGNPIDLSEWRGKPVDARAIRDVSYLIMNTIKDMLGAVRGETPPAVLFDPKKAAPANGQPTGGPPAGERDGTAT